MGKEGRKDKPHLAWVRQQPCLVCATTPCDPHHLLRRGSRGMGMRAPDNWTIPLCRKCHDDLHSFGDEESWFALLGINAYAWAEKYGEEQ